MSKIIKNEKMDEVNSNHLSQMKASIDSLIATHTADDDAHHTPATVPTPRRITSSQIIPQDLVTSGNNNCYWTADGIAHGITSRAGGSMCDSNFHLPSDYVDGQDLVYNLWWTDGQANDVIDYFISVYYIRDDAQRVLIANYDATWTMGNVNWDRMVDSLTIDGTNVLNGDLIQVRLYMEDDSNTNIVYELASNLDVPVA